MTRSGGERNGLFVALSVLGYGGLAALTWMFPGKTSPEWLSYYGVSHLQDVLAGPLAYGAFLVLLALIWLGYLGLVRGRHAVGRWPMVGGLAAPVLAVVASAPALSGDTLLYLSYGRMIAEWGANPYLVAPRAYIADPVIALNQTWADFLAAYGPLWVSVCAAVARVSGDNPLLAIALFRVISLAGHLAGAVLASRLADEGWVFALVALNPLLLIESAFNGHSDGVMAMLFLLGLWLDARGRRTPAWVALAAGCMVKITMLPALALYAVYAWRRGGWRPLLQGVMMCGLVAALLLAPYWAGLEIPRGLLAENTRYDTLSIPYLVHRASARLVAEPLATTLTSVVTLLPALLVLLLFGVRQKGNMLQLVRQSALLIMVWVLIATAHLRQWYLVPAVVLAGVLAPHPIARVSLAFAVGVSVYYASPALAALPLLRLLFALGCLAVPAAWLAQNLVRELREE